MNKEDLVNAVSESTGVSKSDVDAVIGSMFAVVADHVSKSDEKITIPGWISFERTFRKARTGRNPRTGESLEIAATHAVKVSAGSKLKKAAKG
jgi:DNA-binding protein HU-beta